MTLIVVLFLLAFGLIMAEVMFPSFGILGLLAATALLIAVITAFDIGTSTGVSAVVVTLVGVPAAIIAGFWVLQHTSLGNRLVLSGPTREEVAGAGADATLERFVGLRGVAVTPLRPSGIVEFDDGERVDAVSTGAYIQKGTTVVVRANEGNELLVEAAIDNEGSEQP